MPYRRTAEVQARLDAQRARVVGAATQLLAEQGYAGCSMAAVAARAGIASGTLYNHVADKGALVAEVFRVVVAREVDAVRAAVACADTAAEQVAAIVETFAGRAMKAPRLALALLAEPVDPAVDELRLEFRTAFRDIFAAAVAAGIDSGEFPEQDAAVVAAALVGAAGEALVGPLAGRAGPGTVAALITFALRALGHHEGHREGDRRAAHP